MIFNPLSSRPNPKFDPTKPISPLNPQIIRVPFPGNVIPQHLIDPKARLFLSKYVPRPNMEMGMIGCGMTMTGIATVPGTGMDYNNFLDVSNAHHRTDQATIRIDQTFKRGDAFLARY